MEGLWLIGKDELAQHVELRLKFGKDYSIQIITLVYNSFRYLPIKKYPKLGQLGS